MDLQDFAKRIKQLEKEWRMTKEEAEHYLEGIEIINN